MLFSPTKVILPTNNIVSEFFRFNELFVFYNEGIKGLVRDAVLISDLETHKPLIDSVTNSYLESPEAMWCFHMENTNNQDLVELVAECLINQVSEMMGLLFGHLPYMVDKQQWEWLDQDLIALIRVLR